jgi:hypothetical protein
MCIGRDPVAWLQSWLQLRRNGANPRPVNGLAELDALKALENYHRFDTAMAIMICNDEAREYSTGPIGVCGTSSQCGGGPWRLGTARYCPERP